MNCFCDVAAVLLLQIDSLDTLALLGDRERFTASVEWIGKNLRFDIVSEIFFCIKSFCAYPTGFFFNKETLVKLYVLGLDAQTLV